MKPWHAAKLSELTQTDKLSYSKGLLFGLCFLTVSCVNTPLWEPKDGAPVGLEHRIKFHDAIPKEEPPSPYGNPPSYHVMGQTYHVMDSAQGYKEEGIASWYGTKFHGRRTSSGEVYDMFEMTAAHKTLPLPSYVRVTNLDNNRSVIVRVNDRGPFVSNRIIDLSYSAAHKIGVFRSGTAPVMVEHITEDGVPIDNGDAIFLQVGAYSKKSVAETVRKRFAEKEKYPVFLQKLEEQSLYRVRIGPISSMAAGQAIIAKYQTTPFSNLTFVSLESD